MSVTVTVLDDQTGDTETQQIADGDYLVIATDPCRVSHVQSMGMGRTHVVTIKDRRPSPAAVASALALAPDVEQAHETRQGRP